MAEAPPILITGMTRSGTTWAASMLNASGRVVYVNEPLNPRHPPGRSPGLLRADVQHRYQYITDDNEADFRSAYGSMIGLRYHLAAELRRNHTPSDVGRALRHQAMFLRGRAAGRRLMIADPFAVFSAEWFERRLGFQVVIMVRHPLAVVGSRKRLGWRFDIRELLQQPLLLRDWLIPLSTRWPEALAPVDGVVHQGAQLWRLIYETALQQQRCSPRLLLIRHEDLAVDPVAAFSNLYERLGLPFTRSSRGVVERSTAPGNPTRLASNDPHAVRLDSRASLGSWRERLTDDEARYVETVAGPAMDRLYPEGVDGIGRAAPPRAP